MNILLTNDDGVNSGGLQKLAEILRSRENKVQIIAPDQDRSGVSHGISFINGPLKLSELGEDTWSCSGLPADCVALMLSGVFPQKPDLVLSGINQGANLGTDILFSGTAAAARHASLKGIPSIALSLAGEAPYNWDMAAAWIGDHLEELLGYWRENTFVNVNIPNGSGSPQGMASTWPAVKHYKDKLSINTDRNGVQWCFIVSGEETIEQEPGSDCDVVSRNLVSVSTVYNFSVVLRDLCPGVPDHAAVASRGRVKE